MASALLSALYRVPAPPPRSAAAAAAAAKGLCKGAGLHLVVLKEAEMKGSLPSKGGVLCEHVIIVNLAQPDTTSWIKHNLRLTEGKLSVVDSEGARP